MNLTLAFRDVLSRSSHWVMEELDRWAARINALWNVEHNEDGTHGTITSLTATEASISNTLTLGRQLITTDLQTDPVGRPRVCTERDLTTGIAFYETQTRILSAGTSVVIIQTGEVDLTSGPWGDGQTGTTLKVGRNSTEDGCAGTLCLYDRAGTARYLWVDTNGKLRIHSSPPVEGSGEFDGTVVGTQT